MSRFTYWKKGLSVASIPPKVPKNSRLTLFEYRLSRGCYDESPYWKRSVEELYNYECFFNKIKRAKPHASERDIHELTSTKRTSCNKKVAKLREAHMDYEVQRLSLLRRDSIDYFGIDLFDEIIEQCQGSIRDFVQLYREKVNQIKNK